MSLSHCECKIRHVCDKDYTWNPAKCTFENGKHLACIMDDSTITSDDNIDAKAESNDEETNFNEINITCKIQNFYILLTFLLVTITLLTVFVFTVI